MGYAHFLRDHASYYATYLCHSSILYAKINDTHNIVYILDMCKHEILLSQTPSTQETCIQQACASCPIDK